MSDLRTGGDEELLAETGPGVLSRTTRLLRDALMAERGRWANWLPVVLGLGIAFYFQLDFEPALGTAPALLLASLLLLWLMRRQDTGRVLSLALLVFSCGYGAALWRSHDVAAPRLAEEMLPTAIEGRVVGVDLYEERRYRLLLDDLSIDGLEPSETPQRVRITVRIESKVARPGDRVSMRAGLLPPAAPAQPGAYDFGFTAWFQQLGALGYAVTAPEVVAGGGAPPFLAAWRQEIAERLRAAAPGQRGAVAAAIITGDRSGISEDVAEALRMSGIAHLLAISGLHLGLVTGIIFVTLRAILAAVPTLALNYPIKKWAAAAAILAGGGYTLLAGTPIPTERAFVMTLLVLLAVMIDRPAISMRLVAVAAVVILLISPESLFNISFQMSFAAVVALVAAYEAMRRRQAMRNADAPATPRWLVYLGGVGITSIIAGVATDIYGAYHFNHIACYGLITNLIAVPVMSFWVMPWAVVSVILMPFGLEGWAMLPMGWGIDIIIWAAQTVVSWPGAIVWTPAFGALSLGMMTLSGLWLALWGGRWRLFGIAGLMGGLALAFVEPRPDILTNDDGSMVALRTPAGGLALNTGRGSGMTRSTWRERDGQQDLGLWAEVTESETADWLHCDDWGCVYQRRGHNIAILTSERALAEDCARADVIIADFPLPWSCRPRLGKVDRFDMWREGAHALYLAKDGLRIETVAAHQGNRPWSRRPGQ